MALHELSRHNFRNMAQGLKLRARARKICEACRSFRLSVGLPIVVAHPLDDGQLFATFRVIGCLSKSACCETIRV